MNTFLKKIKQNLNIIYKNLITETAYESKEKYINVLIVKIMNSKKITISSNFLELKKELLKNITSNKVLKIY